MAFHHVAITTHDLDATHAFYTEAMGFELVKVEAAPTTESGWARHLFYDTGNGELLAVWDIHDPGLVEYKTEISTGLGLPPWANHIAFDALDRDDLDARLKRWLDHGLDCVRIDHGWCTSIYADDPNGITVEFCTSTRELTADDREQAAALLAAKKPALGSPPEVEFFTANAYEPAMDFAPSPRSNELKARLLELDTEIVRPAEAVYREQRAASGDPHFPPPVMEELKIEARKRDLWNLFMPEGDFGAKLSNLDYAPLCEVMGTSPLLSEATNCAAPDTGNMEILAQFGTALQQEQWLNPLLEGEIRSCFAMTEPWVASSDATNISSRIERDGDDYVINGHKWFTSGALDPRCKVAIFMGVTDPNADAHRRQSMILVPMDAPGVIVVRGLPVFGHSEGGGHGETLWEDVRVRKENLLGEEGGGFAIAQARLGPGRVHHCMRAIGLAERALDLMCIRAQTRVAFGKPLADQGVVRERIAESRMQIEQVRLLTLKTAWMMDTVGKKAAQTEIASIKVIAARVATDVIDRAIQLFGGAGVTDDWPLASMYAHARTLHLVDGPDEVHMRQIARRELGKYAHLRPSGF